MRTDGRLLVIGAGTAGSRFIRAARLLEGLGKAELLGVCDQDPRRADAVQGVPFFTSLDDAYSACVPDAVVVAVTDTAHATVLLDLLGRSSPPRVIACEKPLTSTEAEMLAVVAAASAAGTTITTNYLEECSPVFARYLDWQRQAGVTPIKIEFFWGKNRVGDPRLTLGVLSEISHPIDLVRAILEPGPDELLENVRCLISASDYLPGHVLPESLYFDASVHGCQVVGHCSFAWSSRDRRVTVFSRASDGAVYVAKMSFDKPVWDADGLDVSRYVGNGAWEREAQYETLNTDYPSEQYQLGKLTRFLELSLGAQEPTAFPLVGLTESAWVERVLAQLGTGFGEEVTSFQYSLPHLAHQPRSAEEAS